MGELSLRKKFKTYVTMFTILALAGVAFAIRDQVGDTIINLRNANPWPILLIVPLAALNHLSQGKLYQSVFRLLGDRFRTKSMMRLSLELNFVNNVFPSAGVSGFSYLTFRMRGEEVAAGKATLVQAVRFAMMFLSFQVLLALGLFLLALYDNANNFVIMVTASLSTLLFVGTGLILFIISSKRRLNGFFIALTRGVNRLIELFRPKNPEAISIESVKRVFTDLYENYQKIRKDVSQLGKPFIYALLSNIAEVTAIYVVFMAFGHMVNPGAVILAYAVANFAGVLSVLPGGIGVYEALMTGVLVATGVPVAVSLPVIVTFRVVSMTVQILPGYYFYQRNLHAVGEPK